jgi:tetratricopeptide (TPR) repeat protein
MILRVAALLLALAAPAPDPEGQARAAFTSGHYQEALSLYEQLFRDTGHPTYLRNLGRCHQMLKQPEPAIARFREYLHMVPNAPASTRAEVEGFIAEMEGLRRQQEAARHTPPPPRPPGASFGEDNRLVEIPPRHGETSSHPWLWVAAGAAVAAAGVTLALLLSRPAPSACPECTLPSIRIDTR